MDRERLRELLEHARETLDTEFKAWFSPGSPEGKAKIAKACLALRNNNGGRLIVGVTNTGESQPPPEGFDIDAEFHSDVVQEVVTRFSSDPFEVTVAVVELNDVRHVVVQVPSGATTPAVSKSSLSDDAGVPFVRDNEIYVRTVSSNGRVSSSPARRQDWDRLIGVCFENREAVVGSFVRRHLSSLLDRRQLEEIVPGSAARTVQTFAEDCDRRFYQLWSDRSADLGDYGYRDASCVLSSELHGAPTAEFLMHLFARRRDYSGWPVWIDARGHRDDRTSVYVFEEGWEAWVVSFVSGWSNHFDFWRIEPTGRFHHREALADDTESGQRHPAPRTVLDATHAIARTAETMAVALGFAAAMEAPLESTTLRFLFRWRGLKGRTLTSWMHRDRHFHRRGPSQQDLVATTVDVPMQTPLSALHGFVQPVVDRLFMLFDGAVVSARVVEDICTEVFSRRL